MSGLVLLFGFAQNGQLGVAAVDQLPVGHQVPEVLVAPLKLGILDGDFRQGFGVRMEQLHAIAPKAGHGLPLRFFHGVEHRVEKVQRYHHQDRGIRVGALQFPGDTSGVPRQIFAARLRVDPVGLDITGQADVPDGVRIGIGIPQMRTLSRVGIGEDDFGAGFKACADGFGKRVGRFDGNVDGLIFTGCLVRVKDQRHLRQPSYGAQPGVAQRDRQFQSDDPGPVPQDRLPHLDGEFQPVRHHRKVGEASAFQASQDQEAEGRVPRAYRSDSSPST